MTQLIAALDLPPDRGLALFEVLVDQGVEWFKPCLSG
jgi:hypothetical protein